MPPSIPDPSRTLGLELEEAKGPSVRLDTLKLPWSPSEASALAPSPSEDPSSVPWEAFPMVTSQDLPVMAMLRAPKVWLLPRPTPLPTQTSGVKGHSEAMPSALPSLASETQDPIHPEMYSLPPSLGLTGQGQEAVFLTFSDHRAGSPTTLSQVATDPQTRTSPNVPKEDFGEFLGISPTGLNKAEYTRSSPQVSVDWNIAADFTLTEMATEPTGGRGISGSEVFNTAESPTSSSQASVEEAQGMWTSLHIKELDPHTSSAPSGDPRVSLILEPWAATDKGGTEGPIDTATVDPSDAGRIWESGSRMVEGAERPIMSPQIAVDTKVVTSLVSLDQGDRGGVLATSTMDSFSSQSHPEPEGQIVTQGTLEALVPPHEGIPLGDSTLPPWTPTVGSMDKPVSVTSGEPTVLWDSPSTLLPVLRVLDKFELEVLAGSARMEEASSGEEPALSGTPADGSTEQSEFKFCSLIQPTVVRAWDLGPGELRVRRKGCSWGPGKVSSGNNIVGGNLSGELNCRKDVPGRGRSLGKGRRTS